MTIIDPAVAAIGRVAVVPSILDVVSRMTAMRFVAVARVTDTSWTACAVKDDIAFGLKPGDALELCTTICNEIRQHRSPVVFGHASMSATFKDHPTPKLYGFESYLSFPIIRSDGSLFGTLCAIDPAPAKLDDPALYASLELFANLVATHLDALELHDQRLEAVAAAETAGAQLQLENGRISALLEERSEAERVITRELKDTRLLRDVAARFIVDGGSAEFYREILNAAIEVAGADAGTIQLLEPASQSLTILASRGFNDAMLTHFAVVDASSGSPCGLALATGSRSFVVFDDPALPDIDGSNRLHLDAGLRCAQSTPLMSRSGRALGMFSTHWSQRKELGEREVRFLDLLGRQVADLIERNQVQAALLNSERQLRDEGRRKDEFIAVLAHELRNPLAPIRSGIEVLKRAAGNAELVERVRPMMERQIAHVVRLVDDLLDVSRLSSGKVQLRRDTVSLGQLVNSAVEAHAGQAASSGIELVQTLHDERLTLQVDPNRISQVISNLLHNAVKFTPAGGTITIASSEAVDVNGRTLVLRMTDTGIGIAPEALPTVFNLFTQARTDRHGGMGIGLSLSRQLMVLHQGSIEAQSRGHGEGSEFIIRLPLAAMSDPEPAPLDATTVEDIAGVRVLVVDDNKDAAESIALLLAQSRASVQVAHEAGAIVALVKDFEPDLVLLDIGLPGVDGYEACTRLRGAFGSAIRLVALTGWGQEEDRRRALEAGFDWHLTKPVDFASLARVASRAPIREQAGPR